MLITDDLAAVLNRDPLNAGILAMFADGMTDAEIVTALPSVSWPTW
jgi:hypothetical protein